MTRIVAAAIDGILVGFALLVGYLALAGFLFLVNPRGFTFPEVGLVFSMASAFVVLVVYLSVSWWISGRSYGCLVMGLRVLSHREEHLGAGWALVRALFCVVFPIGLLWVAASRENRSLQDVLLRTSVVYDWQPRAEPRPPSTPAEST